MNNIVDLLGRILLSLMFLLSGLNKIGSYAPTQGYMESHDVPGALLPLVIPVEIAAPPLVVLGWHTRLAAMALAGFSIFAAILFHSDFADQMQMIMFMKNIAIAGGFMILAARGAGAISVDARGTR